MKNDLVLRAFRGQRTERTPIWLMRQAGRCLPDYRAIRSRHSLLSIARDPELASEVTLLPVEILGVDAAICFSDIMLPLGAMGIRFELKDGIGPVVRNTIKGARDVEKMRAIDPKTDMSFVMDTVRLAKKRARVPVVGLAGAPFTLASYIIEGSYNKNFTKTKWMLHNKPDVWSGLMSRLASMTADYLKEQMRSGADAVQLFDSWAGCLSPNDYGASVLPYTKRIFSALKGKGPTIHFTTDTSAFLHLIKDAGSDVVSVDWRIGLADAWARIGHSTPIQGNLDPGALLGTKRTIRKAATEVLDAAGGRKGHIFNLGHGVLPGTPLENVRYLVDFVKGGAR